MLTGNCNFAYSYNKLRYHILSEASSVLKNIITEETLLLILKT